MTRRLWSVSLPNTTDERDALWTSLLQELRDRIGFAHVDLIPDESQLSRVGASIEVHAAFRVLSLAASRDSPSATRSSSGPAPLGAHIELHHPGTFRALEVYGPHSINVHVWRESDREYLSEREPTLLRPDPMIDQMDSMEALLLSVDDAEHAGVDAWAARSGVHVDLFHR